VLLEDVGETLLQRNTRPKISQVLESGRVTHDDRGVDRSVPCWVALERYGSPDEMKEYLGSVG
jgi:hypothetical protein